MANAAMSIATLRLAASPERRRGVAILAGSLVLHALVLTPLAIRLFEAETAPIAYDPPTVFVEMEPRPLLDGETAREPTFARTPQVEAAPLTAASEATTTLRRDPADEDAPTPPSPREAAAAPPGAPVAPANPWAVARETLAGAVGRTLRTGPVGCRTMDGRLSAAEQQLCDDRFNAAAARARPLGPRTLTPGQQRAQAEFQREGARALALYEARRRPLAGGVGVVGPAECPGSNLGTGCAGVHLDPAMRQGSPSVVNPGVTGGDPAERMRPLPGAY